MANIVTPNWQALQQLIASSHDQLLICTPYFSSAGVGRVFDSLHGHPRVRFWTRLSPSDWANGVSDPPQLLALAEILLEAGFGFEIGIHQRLHGKAYVADRSAALIGSSNLSQGGFARNAEFMILFQGEETGAVLDHVVTACQPALRVITPAALREWIGTAEPTVIAARASAAGEPEVLAPAQAALDHLLGYGGPPVAVIEQPALAEMETFIAWLRANATLPGAGLLLRRHDDADGHHLQGHFRQSFFGSLLFFRENPAFIPDISQALDQIEDDRLYEPSDAVAIAWIQHLDEHATDVGPNYNYAILRGILPPSWGGTREGGGGGISTIKRMLPLVSRYLAEQGA